VTWEGGGNVPPAVALGYQLSRAGHDVRVLGPRSAAGEVSAAGLRFVPYVSVPAWPEDVVPEDDFGLLGTLLNGDGWWPTLWQRPGASRRMCWWSTA
jgi:hypothetical protein